MPARAPVESGPGGLTFYPQAEVEIWHSAPPRDDPASAAAHALREGMQGRFPPRYHTLGWRRPLDERLAGALEGVSAVLDVGAGARPTVPPERRPEGCEYVGLDIDGAELAAAPAGSYDETLVRDVAEADPEQAGRFDLVVSWFAFEHAGSLAAALRTVRTYLRPGGRLLAQFSGRHAVFSTVNRILPDVVSRRIVTRATGRPAESVFPATYEGCDYASIRRLLDDGWADVDVVALHTSGLYWTFSRPLLGAYLAYEELAWRRDWRRLAGYYLIDARRAA